MNTSHTPMMGTDLFLHSIMNSLVCPSLSFSPNSFPVSKKRNIHQQQHQDLGTNQVKLAAAVAATFWLIQMTGMHFLVMD